MSCDCLSTMLSNSFRHSSFPSPRASIYLSALPFTPEHSLVSEKFCAMFPNTLIISDSRPSQWPTNIFVAEHHKGHVLCIVRSLDEKTFASISASSQQCVTVYVCDSEIGHCISGPFELRGLDLSD